MHSSELNICRNCNDASSCGKYQASMRIPGENRDGSRTRDRVERALGVLARLRLPTHWAALLLAAFVVTAALAVPAANAAQALPQDLDFDIVH